MAADIPLTVLTEPQVGSFAAPPSGQGVNPLNIPIAGRADLYILPSSSGRSFTLTLRLGGSITVAAAPGMALVADGRLFSTVQISTANGGAFWAIVTLDQPVHTFGGPTSPTTQTVAQGSPPWQVEVEDASGNLGLATFANGSPCPANGVVWALIVATSTDAVTLTDGTTSKTLIASASGNWTLVQWHAVAGVTYTLSGTGLAILGTKLTVALG